MRHETKLNKQQKTSNPRGLESDPVAVHLRRRGKPVTLGNYLAAAGLSKDDLDDAELRTSLPESIQQLLDNEHGPDLAWDFS